MKYEWYTFPNYYTSEECDNIIAKYSKEVKEAEVGGDKSDLTTTTVDKKVRTSKVNWVRDEKIRDKAIQSFYTANVNGFNFNIDYTYLNNIQFTEYDESYKGAYHEHIDSYLLDNCEDGNKTGFYDRKLSLVVALTDPKEYEGGDFLLYSIIYTQWTEIQMPKGSAIVFPSFFPHRVTPVIKGRRNTLVSWAEGEHFR